MHSKPTLLPLIIVAIALTGLSCNSGKKVSMYDNVGFHHARGECIAMTFTSGTPPKHIEIGLPDGQKLPLASLTREQAFSIFGEPTTINHPKKGNLEKFGTYHIAITFCDGKFTEIDVSYRFTIVNLENGKSMKLPAPEAKIRELFGKPTDVKYVRSQQP